MRFRSCPVERGTSTGCSSGCSETRRAAGDGSGYPGLLRDAFGDLAGEVEARSSAVRVRVAERGLATVLTDRMWRPADLRATPLLAERVPTYAYEFADRRAPMYLPFPEQSCHRRVPRGRSALPVQRRTVRSTCLA